MKEYMVSILMKKGTGENESDTMTLVRVSVENEHEILKTALRESSIVELTASGHRFEMYVYIEV